MKFIIIDAHQQTVRMMEAEEPRDIYAQAGLEPEAEGGLDHGIVR